MIPSIESRRSWVAAWTALVCLSITYAAPLILVVALKPIAGDLDVPRSVPALAGSLAYFGTGLGGVPMGWLADRIGVRRLAVMAAFSIALGLVATSMGGIWGMYLGGGLLIGLCGNGAVNAPLIVYITRWFDRRRGAALALIGSGPYIAGAVWPSIFERGIAHVGWRMTMLLFASFVLLVLIPVALIFLRPPPAAPVIGSARAGPLAGAPVLGLHPNVVLALMSLAIFLCCVPMALPTAHLVSFCTDLGFTPADGAAMLSVLLACAFVSRQFWGWLADRIGGMRTVAVGASLQAITLSGFLMTQDEAGLFAVSAAFGLGFSGIVPAYILAARALFPEREAGWRIPAMLLPGLSGMAVGGWMGGAIYDHFASYAPAFQLGVATNLLNLLVVGFLLSRPGHAPRRALFSTGVLG